MKIVDIEITPFRYQADRYQNGQAYPKREIIQTLTRIVTDEGAEGLYFGGQGHGDQEGLVPATRAYIQNRIKPMLVGQDPFDRELFWQWLYAAKTPENVLSVIDLALWDLLGRVAGLPVAKLLGGCREKVKAYASTYPNMGSPENYAAHALACKQQGYRAYKIHPYYYWDPATGQAVQGRPSHIEWDLAACRAVREAVGDDMVLMYDPWGTYHIYEEALRVGRELEKLNFYWYEHPMPEHRVDTYIRLARELSIPICSPEILEGSVFTRADWIRQGASDISRIDVLRGGITGVKKTVAVCEAYGIRCEIHMSGIGNLHILGSTSEDTCEYYERGLLAPGVDYDAPLPYLTEVPDALDADGYVHVPRHPGLGYQINWDYINENRIAE
ncbi:MAG TPA: enolase C-terminal domain-like protein [Chloroflexota bacterium]|nr:enolase C-terminal domain-like protein [Chloroflexota bacterium]